ncbi:MULTISPECIES: energy-coupling factor transporter transmembrane component T [Providencia]|uniref:ABC-type cobalt transport system, permease component CbiQ and related transporters n=1 Tax=Providencia rettgeri TaxID=587 RepID=A0A379FQU0_PRORE|nr:MULTISPECIES: energy-coupling factor transporter transmembrane component T [Providencia]EJF7711405.1 energy-coupling factor transporter transmembrane protein EcfT [Providencia rettgeri]MCX9107528.1 energy-coupling factor transporter transmembrane protein EcfT [Providencia rettgeri]MDH2364493.1 energy-coupling factor transporter transmembrane component T [Providencia rettgeri]QXB04096.1 energy-coupling factor transporter transmembrane protein EcfT [Providencia rettgeri]SUC31174.1 ABC-type co
MHPFTSLTIWFWLSVSSLFLPLNWLLIVLGCSIFAALLFWRPARHRWRIVAWIMLPMAAGLWLIHGGWLAQQLTGDALKNSRPEFALALWFKLLTIISASQLWLQYVPTERFIRALFASRLPASFAYLLAGPLLLAEQFRQQLNTIREAQLARGVPLDGRFWQRVTSLPALLFPLASNTLSDLSIRGAALDMRGFRYCAKRTTLNPPTDSSFQALLRYGLVLLIFIEGGLSLWW